jgi:hypothetical protein
MNTATSPNRNSGSIENALSGMMFPKTETNTYVQETEAHPGKSISYYLEVYVVIFSSILAIVLIFEGFFFK